MIVKIDTNQIIKDIESKGFLSVNNILSDDDIDVLTDKCKKIILNESDYTDKPAERINGNKIYDISKSVITSYKTINRNILGNSEEIDIILEKFFSNSNLKKILGKILGTEYKMYTCALRHATHDSISVGMHQDASYQFTVSILLNDINSNNPTTTFCEGSHLIPFNFGSKFEAFDTKYFKNILKPATGSKGDVLFFFNKALHGMKTSQNISDNSTAILCCLQPSGYPCPRWSFPLKSKYKENFMDSLGPSLKNLMIINDHSFEKINGEAVLKRYDHASRRIIDKIANKKNYSFLEYITAFGWLMRYIYFFSFRVLRKIYRIVKS